MLARIVREGPSAVGVRAEDAKSPVGFLQGCEGLRGMREKMGPECLVHRFVIHK
jgi:hypothetical protein